MTLALAVIAKNEVEQVKSIIEKYGEFFNEIVLAVDERIDEFQKLVSPKTSIYPYQWCDDFAHKRNFLAEKIKSPYYFRMDTDDEIGNPQTIKPIFDGIVANGVDLFYTIYDYAKDSEGNVIARHWRETIIKKRSDVYWKKPIHENVFMENQTSCKLARDKSFKIIHNTNGQHAVNSSNRNFQYLLDEFKRDGEKTDPRTFAYLGRMLMGDGLYEKAIFFLEKLVARSGWDDDKYFAYVQMSQCYLYLNKPDLAVACCNEALAINTKFPDAFIQMGCIYLHKNDYDKAVDWIMPGIVRPEPDTVMVLDPLFYSYGAKMNAAMALLGKGETEMALKYFLEAKQANPNSQEIKKYEPVIVDAVETKKYIHNLTWLAFFTQSRDPSRLKVQSLMDSIPQQLYCDERIWQIHNTFAVAKQWGVDEIAVFCGSSWEEWSPASVLKGIGGSEEAVICLSQELAKLGWKVTVFNNCGEMTAVYKGVEYKPFYAFNPKDKFNVVVSWRGNVLRGIDAKQRIVWLHDVPLDGMFTGENVRDFDKVVVLSNYHRSLLPQIVPSEKVFVSSNGINYEEFRMDGVLRNPRRMIYTSSYDRGLEHLLRMWSQVREAVPDVELHIFYGWDVYDEMVKKGFRDPKFKESLLPLMRQEGITDHGRVGHKRLIHELKMSGVWVYPCHFDEISCISAMKAQAAGCVPVCTNYAALTETVKYGIKTEGGIRDAKGNRIWKEALIQTLKDETAQEEVRAKLNGVGETFGWDGVARQWHESLFIRYKPKLEKTAVCQDV